MSVVSFLDTGFRFKERHGVTDVQTIIDDFAAEVLTPNDPAKKWRAWTDLGGGRFASPTDAYGRVMYVQLTKVDVNKLEVTLQDQNLLTIFTRRVHGVLANSWTVRLFTGTYHAFLDLINYSAIAEGFNCNILDQWPDPPGGHPVYVCGYGQRDGAGADSGSYGYEYLAITQTPTAPAGTTCITKYGAGGTGSTTGRKALSGQKIFRPREVWGFAARDSGMSSYKHYCGRCCQQLLVDGSTPFGARIPVPIDTGVLGEFCVLASTRNTASEWGLMVRSA